MGRFLTPECNRLEEDAARKYNLMGALGRNAAELVARYVCPVHSPGALESIHLAKKQQGTAKPFSRLRKAIRCYKRTYNHTNADREKQLLEKTSRGLIIGIRVLASLDPCNNDVRTAAVLSQIMGTISAVHNLCMLL